VELRDNRVHPIVEIFVVDFETPKNRRKYPHWFRARVSDKAIWDRHEEMVRGYALSNSSDLQSLQVFLARTVNANRIVKRGALSPQEIDFIKEQQVQYDFEEAVPKTARHFGSLGDFEGWLEEVLPEDLEDLIFRSIKKAKIDCMPQVLCSGYYIDKFGGYYIQCECRFHFPLRGNQERLNPTAAYGFSIESEMMSQRILESALSIKKLKGIFTWMDGVRGYARRPSVHFDGYEHNISVVLEIQVA
jgi:hypothetical protein